MEYDVENKLDLAPEIKRLTHSLDEETEKELEQEIEEQQQVERPRVAQPAAPKFDLRLEQLVRDGVIGDIFDQMKSDGTVLSIVASLTTTQMFDLCKDEEDAWSDHLFVTSDYKLVVENEYQACNDYFLKPVSWIACIKNPDSNDILIILSSFECNRLLPIFRQSKHAALFMYRPRHSNLHNNLIHEAGLQVTGMATTNTIAIEDEVQIGVYAGLMYFNDVREQQTYCEFLGTYFTHFFNG